MIKQKIRFHFYYSCLKNLKSVRKVNIINLPSLTLWSYHSLVNNLLQSVRLEKKTNISFNNKSNSAFLITYSYNLILETKYFFFLF